MSLLNIYHMEQVKKPLEQYNYSEDEWQDWVVVRCLHNVIRRKADNMS